MLTVMSRGIDTENYHETTSGHQPSLHDCRLAGSQDRRRVTRSKAAPAALGPTLAGSK